MKNTPNNLKISLIVLATLLLCGRVAQTQDPYSGIWEGKIMQDFESAILLDINEEGTYTGKILMFSGENRIQELR